MKSNRIVRTIFIFLILGCNVGCDQIAKIIVRKNISFDEHISLIPNHFTLTKIENSGAFLSLGTSLPQPLKFVLLTMMPVVALCLALIFLFSKWNLPDLTILGISFVIGGGIGNLYDRIVYGSVTDFLHIDFGLFQTGVFNMADVSIMVGMFMILSNRFFSKSKPGHAPTHGPRPENQ